MGKVEWVDVAEIAQSNVQLTEQQERFAQAYVMTGDAIFAAEQADYTRPTAGWRLLAQPKIRERVQALILARYVTDRLPQIVETAVALAQDPTVRAGDRVRALELVGKWVGLDQTRTGRPGGRGVNVVAINNGATSPADWIRAVERRREAVQLETDYASRVQAAVTLLPDDGEPNAGEQQESDTARPLE